MLTWILRLIGIGFIGFLGLAVYQSSEKGYFNLPDMAPTDYAFSIHGFRGIVKNAEVSEPVAESMPNFFRRLNLANRDRSYFGVPLEVQEWMKDAWFFCLPPTDEERTYYENGMPEEIARQLEFAQFEAVCSLDVDGNKVVRGLLYSIPKL